jgi:hypothetical protein
MNGKKIRPVYAMEIGKEMVMMARRAVMDIGVLKRISVMYSRGQK